MKKFMYFALFCFFMTLANPAFAIPVNPNPVPEPATMTLLGLGLGGLAFFFRKRD